MRLALALALLTGCSLVAVQVPVSNQFADGCTDHMTAPGIDAGVAAALVAATAASRELCDDHGCDSDEKTAASFVFAAPAALFAASAILGGIAVGHCRDVMAREQAAIARERERRRGLRRGIEGE